jgi:hypothetical protein
MFDQAASLTVMTVAQVYLSYSHLFSLSPWYYHILYFLFRILRGIYRSFHPQFFRSLIAAIAGEVGKERELYGQSLVIILPKL